MEKIRIGKDIQLMWSITTDGQPTPLEGRDLTLEIRDAFGKIRTLDFTPDGNTITTTYHGIDQYRLGSYTLTLWENKGQIGQNVVDKSDAFYLVPYTELEGQTDSCHNIEVVTVDLGTSNFVVGGGGCNIQVLQTTGQSTTAVMSQKAVTDLIVSMQNKMSEMQDQIDQLIAGGGGDVPVLPTVTDALMLNNGKYLMLRNGNYIKIKSTIN